MQLNNVMTQDEQDVTAALIAAHLKMESAKAALREAEKAYSKVARQFTELWRRTNKNDESIGTIPESFVAFYDGSPYFIQVDIDGESRHKVVLLVGILRT